MSLAGGFFNRLDDLSDRGHFLAVFSLVLFENTARKFYARKTTFRHPCTQASQTDRESFLEKLPDRKANFIVRIHTALLVLYAMTARIARNQRKKRPL